MAKLYAGTWLDEATIDRLDRIAGDLHGSRSHAVRYVIESALAGQQVPASLGAK